MAMPPSASENPIGATVNLTTMAALVRLKRGSVQLRHAAREVRGTMITKTNVLQLHIMLLSKLIEELQSYNSKILLCY